MRLYRKSLSVSVFWETVKCRQWCIKHDLSNSLPQLYKILHPLNGAK